MGIVLIEMAIATTELQYGNHINQSNHACNICHILKLFIIPRDYVES